MNSKLSVRNLASTTVEDTLWSLFSQSGTVISVDLIKDHVTGRSKGYAFIVMSSPLAAEAAVETLDGRNVDGSQIRVSFAQRREDPKDLSKPDSKQSRRHPQNTRGKR